MIAIATFTAVRFGGIEARRLRAEVDQLEQERQRLLDYARRLGTSRRVAQVDVVKQRVNDRGETVSTLLWQEIGREGTLGKPLAVEAVGELVYFESLVIKCQAPDSVPELDRRARPPLGRAERDDPLHAELWQRFWEMVDDPQLAEEYGVRVVQCEAPAVPLQAGQVWELTLDAAGGLNLRRIADGAGEARSAVPEITRQMP